MGSSDTRTPVAPAVPVAAYVGGKRNLSRRLVQMIEATPHSCYAEPFVGMGGVFLRRRSRPGLELINDFSRDVANLYRVIQRHLPALEDQVAFMIASRDEFDRQTALPADALTDIERAARFLYLQRLAFGGKVVQRNFGIIRAGAGRASRFDQSQLRPLLRRLRDRLTGVIIERMDFEAFIRTYDRPGVLFYLDPPYFGSEGYYGEDLFGRPDFERLAATLKGLRADFILSINDAPEIRRLFGWARLTSVELPYTLSHGVTEGRELIIRP